MVLYHRSLRPPRRDGWQAMALAGAAQNTTPGRDAYGERPLDRLRRRLVTAGLAVDVADADSAMMAPLLAAALRHVDALLEHGLETLPWPVCLFGRAHVTRRKLPYLHPDSSGGVKFLDLDSDRREKLPPPDMCYGAPVDVDADVTTGDAAAVLLYGAGTVACLPPRHAGRIGALGRPWGAPRDLRRAPWQASPSDRHQGGPRCDASRMPPWHRC